jgi:HEAT repeat protein
MNLSTPQCRDASGRNLAGRLLIGCCAVLAAAGGCSNGSWFFKKKPDPVLANLSIESPQQRVEKLQEMANTARAGDAATQEKISAELAQAIQTEEDALIRSETLRVLSYCKTPTAAAVLTAAMRDADRDVRITCCDAWAERKGEDAARNLTDMLNNDKNVDVRLAAARGLGKLGDPAAATALAAALEEGDPAMQYRAVQSLKSVSGRDFGNDANAWREFANGGNPQPPSSGLAGRWFKWF